VHINAPHTFNSTSEQRPTCKMRHGKNKVQAPTYRYKLHLRDDDARVHACQSIHQIGNEGEKCMYARSHHHQKNLSTITVAS
jgi:hypothetical protein